MNTKTPMQLEVGDIIAQGEERLRVAYLPRRGGRGKVELITRANQGPATSMLVPAGYVFFVEVRT